MTLSDVWSPSNDRYRYSLGERTALLAKKKKKKKKEVLRSAGKPASLDLDSSDSLPTPLTLQITQDTKGRDASRIGNSDLWEGLHNDRPPGMPAKKYCLADSFRYLTVLSLRMNRPPIANQAMPRG